MGPFKIYGPYHYYDNMIIIFYAEKNPNSIVNEKVNTIITLLSDMNNRPSIPSFHGTVWVASFDHTKCRHYDHVDDTKFLKSVPTDLFLTTESVDSVMKDVKILTIMIIIMSMIVLLLMINVE